VVQTVHVRPISHDLSRRVVAIGVRTIVSARYIEIRNFARNAQKAVTVVVQVQVKSVYRPCRIVARYPGAFAYAFQAAREIEDCPTSAEMGQFETLS